jgi:hypothetical protein
LFTVCCSTAKTLDWLTEEEEERTNQEEVPEVKEEKVGYFPGNVVSYPATPFHPIQHSGWWWSGLIEKRGRERTAYQTLNTEDLEPEVFLHGFPKAGRSSIET